MSADKYLHIISCQMEAIFYLLSLINQLLSNCCIVFRSLLPFVWLFEDRSLIHITATRLQKVREPLLDMEIHGEQHAA